MRRPGSTSSSPPGEKTPGKGSTDASPAARAVLRANLVLDRQLCFALYGTSLAFTRAYKPLLAPLGLTYPQYLVMMALWETEPLAVKALGERLGLDSGTLSPLLKRLDAAGLVTRTRAQADERQVLVSLTGPGRALQEQALDVFATIGDALGCSLEALGALRDDLTRVRHRLLAFAEAQEATGGQD